jgi:hypothetical protein
MVAQDTPPLSDDQVRDAFAETPLHILLERLPLKSWRKASVDGLWLRAMTSRGRPPLKEYFPLSCRNCMTQVSLTIRYSSLAPLAVTIR